MSKPSIKQALEKWSAAIKEQPEDRFKIVNVEGFGNIKLDLGSARFEDATIEDDSMLITIDIKFKV